MAQGRLIWTDVLGQIMTECPKKCSLASVSLGYSSHHILRACLPLPENEIQQCHPLDTLLCSQLALCLTTTTALVIFVSVISGQCYHYHTYEQAEIHQSDKLTGLTD